MRLIDANKIGLTDFEILMCNGNYKEGLEMILQKIEDAPTIDAVPVVRCRECVYCGSASDGWCQCENTGAGMPLDGFCSDGERKDGDGDG